MSILGDKWQVTLRFGEEKLVYEGSSTRERRDTHGPCCLYKKDS